MPKPSPSSSRRTRPRREPELQFVTVTGVRESQIRAIELKRLAPSIQDSISAESIGQLPDVTITDALQRITGVQINRDAGVGTSVDVRGLPQVGTMLNGEVFITPDQIDSQQPDFTTLPATLFNQVDVIKSATASQTEGGISGALDLHTYRPWDLPHGFTYSYSVDGERGDTTKKTGPEASGLISYNADGRWGLQISGDYSDTTRTNSTEGLDQYGVIFHGENGYSAAAYNGFLGAWNGAAIPSKIVQNPDGSVDVNGDGKSNGVFMGSQDISLYDISTQRKRKSANASFQADLGSGFTMTSDYFYAHQDQWDRNFGIQFNSTNWQGATYVPMHSRDTGSTTLGQYNTPDDPNAASWVGSHIYTTRCTRNGRATLNRSRRSRAGGLPLRTSISSLISTMADRSGEVCAACARRRPNTSSRPTSTFPIPTAACGRIRTVRCPAGRSSILHNWAETVYSTPSEFRRTTIPITANLGGRNLTVSMPPALASAFANPNGWTMKTLESTDDYDQTTAITALRFDGHYDFNESFHLEFWRAQQHPQRRE